MLQPSKKRWVLWAAILFVFGISVHRLYQTASTDDASNTVTIKASAQPSVQYNRTVQIHLTTGSSDANPFVFYPDKESLSLHPGELKKIDFHVENTSDKAAQFYALPHISPKAIAPFLAQAVTFTGRTWSVPAHKSITLPVTLMVNPDLPKATREFTLNYTLFPGKMKQKARVQ